MSYLKAMLDLSIYLLNISMTKGLRDSRVNFCLESLWIKLSCYDINWPLCFGFELLKCSVKNMYKDKFLFC